MNFKSFITESADDIFQTVHRDCSMFLAEVGKVGMYRGIKNPPSGVLNRITPVTGRKPLSTSIELHNFFNQAFKEVHGVENIRSRAVFCAGTVNNSYYGHMHRIFPVGHYEYWWSPKVHDLFEDLQDVDLEMDEVKHFVKKVKYRNEGLTTALKAYKFHEVMLLCDSYYAISVDNIELLNRIDNEL